MIRELFCILPHNHNGHIMILSSNRIVESSLDVLFIDIYRASLVILHDLYVYVISRDCALGFIHINNIIDRESSLVDANCSITLLAVINLHLIANLATNITCRYIHNHNDQY